MNLPLGLLEESQSSSLKPEPIEDYKFDEDETQKTKDFTLETEFCSFPNVSDVPDSERSLIPIQMNYSQVSALSELGINETKSAFGSEPNKTGEGDGITKSASSAIANLEVDAEIGAEDVSGRHFTSNSQELLNEDLNDSISCDLSGEAPIILHENSQASQILVSNEVIHSSIVGSERNDEIKNTTEMNALPFENTMGTKSTNIADYDGLVEGDGGSESEEINNCIDDVAQKDGLIKPKEILKVGDEHGFATTLAIDPLVVAGVKDSSENRPVEIFQPIVNEENPGSAVEKLNNTESEVVLGTEVENLPNSKSVNVINSEPTGVAETTNQLVEEGGVDELTMEMVTPNKVANETNSDWNLFVPIAKRRKSRRTSSSAKYVFSSDESDGEKESKPLLKNPTKNPESVKKAVKISLPMKRTARNSSASDSSEPDNSHDDDYMPTQAIASETNIKKLPKSKTALESPRPLSELVSVNIKQTNINKSTPSRKRAKAIQSSLFEDYHFIITLARNSLKDKKELLESLKAHSATVIDGITLSIPPNLFVISCQPLRTKKYLWALATGVPTVSLNWVEDCIAYNRILEIDYYLLGNGISVYSDSIFTTKVSKVFKEIKLGLWAGSEWADIVIAGGGTIIWLKSVRKSELLDDVHVFCSQFSPASEEKKLAIECKKHIVTTEWIIQCLVHGAILEPASNEKFLSW